MMELRSIAGSVHGPQCRHCTTALPFEFSFAFQPIVDIRDGSIFSYEALVRGVNGESAWSVLSQVTFENQYAFDQMCRMKALALAGRLGIRTRINLNFMPNAIYRPELCIRSTIAAAQAMNFPIEDIVFELTEGENVADHAKLIEIFSEYSRLGFKTAIDDFGAGFSGLALIADFQPDMIKLDMGLVRDIDTLPAKQAIARAVVSMCAEMSIMLVAEGIESQREFEWLRQAGVSFFQGYYFAHPAFEALPQPRAIE